MWYFCWILGIGVALGLGLINVLSLEAREAAGPASPDARGPAGPITANAGIADKTAKAV